MLRRWISVVVVAVVGCSDGGQFKTNRDSGPGSGEDAYVPPAPEAGTTPTIGDRVYAHSAAELYKIDPETLEVTRVGAFTFADSELDSMTDIALDRAGRMIGISFDAVYEIDKATAGCRRLAPLSFGFNGLSFISANGSAERLVATTGDGSVYQVDPASGQATQIGHFGGGLSSSGDLVSVQSFGTVATVKRLGSFTDLLARIDPKTGAAKVIGETGYTNIWGLGFWKDKVYGFTEDGRFLLINPGSGQASEVERVSGAWWGAGVTTSAPVIK